VFSRILESDEMEEIVNMNISNIDIDRKTASTNVNAYKGAENGMNLATAEKRCD
jgi:hypothetical protein